MKKNAPKMIVHFAGGGTGGHFFPALAIADALKQQIPDAKIIFWGTKRGIENKLLPGTPYSLEMIPVRGFQRRFTAANLIFPFVLLGSLGKVFYKFMIERPQAVVGTGGYVSGPVAFVAWILWIPVFIQEQNSFPGVTTRILSKMAKRVYVTFESSKKYFKNQNKVLVTGNPVRPDLLRRNRSEALKKFGLSSQKQTLFVFGGSQGARRINQLVTEILPDLLETHSVQIIWSAGSSDFPALKQKVGEWPDVHLYEFLKDMPSAYTVADLVICRSGATTLSEITAVGRPSILIPYPFAAANHQEYNARSLEKAGAAICLLEGELTAEKLKNTIQELLSNPDRLDKMAQAARRLAKPDAAEKICVDILSQLQLHGKKREVPIGA